MIQGFLKTVKRMLRPGWKPVKISRAIQRSDICHKCPYNVQAGLPLNLFGSCVILAMRIISKDTDVRELKNVKVGKCDLCGCSLKSKIWVPPKDIKATTHPGMFPAYCWQHQAHT